MALQYLFDPNKQFQSIGGVNEVGGFLRVYLNGTDDRAVTYRNFDGGMNEPDIVLDTYGRSVVIVDDTKTYRLEVYNRLGGLMWTISNYKARGGSGGSGTPVSVEGTASEIDVYENTVGGVKHFIVSLAENVKNAISSLTSAVNGLALSLGNKKELQIPKSFSGSTTKTPTSFTQNENGEITVTYSPIAFPDWTSAINAATDLCEKLANKKTTFSGFETSDTFYPTLKAVVEYLDGRLQNLGGKKITNNGVPFTTASQLPTTTPYYGQNINSNDYAYVQDTGIASRYTAIVTSSSVSWSLDYEISLPVFTAEQQAAIDSGVNSTKVGNYDAHIANTSNPHGVTYSQVGASPDTHTHQVVINGVTKTIPATGGSPVDLGTYLTSHQDLSDYLSKTGDGSNVTSTFTAASSRTNISSGEKLSTIFGKIAKWFSDLKAVAFSGSYNDLSNTPTIPTELPVKIEEIGNSLVDLDNLTASDMKVHYYTWSNGNRGNIIHKPTDSVYTIKVFPCGAESAGTYVMQEAYKRGTTERYVRRRSDGGTAWSDWQLCTYSNESYPNMGVGTATHLSASVRLDTWSSTYDENNPFVLAAEITWELGTSKNNGAGQLLQFEFANSNYALIRLNYITKGNNVNTTKAVVLNSNFSNSEISDLIRITHFKYDSDTKFAVRVYIKFTGNWQVWSIRQLDAQSGDEGYTNWVPMTLHNQHGSNVAAPTGTSATYVFPLSEFADSAKQISDNRGTEGQDGYKNIYGGYNSGTGEFGLGISKRESGYTKSSEVNADGITTTEYITAAKGFIGPTFSGVANQAVSDSDGNAINTTYAKKISGIFNIDQYLAQGATFHDVNLRKQLGPRYTQSRGFSPLMMFYGIINFVDIEYADGYDYAAVDFELYNTQQSGTYGTLMASIGMVVPKGTSSIVIPLPFSWNGGSFSPTLYGNFVHRITAGSAVCNAYYYSLPV